MIKNIFNHYIFQEGLPFLAVPFEFDYYWLKMALIFVKIG